MVLQSSVVSHRQDISTCNDFLWNSAAYLDLSLNPLIQNGYVETFDRFVYVSPSEIQWEHWIENITAVLYLAASVYNALEE